uniref:SAP domain-containing protein n=1 Tax=Strigamia maritima TaxID=126957 RepID=T1JBV9_STRMM
MAGYWNFTVAALKKELMLRNTVTTGRKADLIERIAADNEEVNNIKTLEKGKLMYDGRKIEAGSICVVDNDLYFTGLPKKAQDVPGTNSIDLSDPRPEKYRNLPGTNDHFRNLTINFCNKSGMDMSFRYLFPKADLQTALLDHDYLTKPFVEYWIDNSLKEGNFLEIEKKTRKQANSSAWFQQRLWRITASRFGEICKLTKRRNMTKLCRSFNSMSCRGTAV